jgi:hypothetical protein
MRKRGGVVLQEKRNGGESGRINVPPMAQLSSGGNSRQKGHILSDRNLRQSPTAPTLNVQLFIPWIAPTSLPADPIVNLVQQSILVIRRCSIQIALAYCTVVSRLVPVRESNYLVS